MVSHYIYLLIDRFILLITRTKFTHTVQRRFAINFLQRVIDAYQRAEEEAKYQHVVTFLPGLNSCPTSPPSTPRCCCHRHNCPHTTSTSYTPNSATSTPHDSSSIHPVPPPPCNYLHSTPLVVPSCLPSIPLPPPSPPRPPPPSPKPVSHSERVHKVRGFSNMETANGARFVCDKCHCPFSRSAAYCHRRFLDVVLDDCVAANNYSNHHAVSIRNIDVFIEGAKEYIKQVGGGLGHQAGNEVGAGTYV